MKVLKRSVVLWILALSVLAPAAHADASGTGIVGWVDAARVANGLPALTEDATASADCLDLVRFMTDHHVPMGLYPQGVPPGIGPAGATAVSQSILYWTGTGMPSFPNPGPWTAAQSPFEEAAFRLPLLLAPRLDHLGAAESGDYGCATALTGQDRAAPGADITYTYPGGGVSGWTTSQWMGPLDRPGGAAAPVMGPVTGPHLYVFFDGPDFDPAAPAKAHVTAATLTGPDGAVPVDTWDDTTADVPATLPSSVQLIPVAALKPSATYTASVTALVTPVAGGAARTFTKTWSFTTAAERANHLLSYGAYTDIYSGQTRALYVSEAPNAVVTATGPGTAATGTPTAPDPGSSASAVLLPIDRKGDWRVCVSSGGPGTGYRAASVCSTARLGGDPLPSFGPPAARPVVTPTPRPKLKVSVPKAAKARRRGRVVTVSGVRCSAACTLRVTAAVRVGRKTYRLGTARVARRSAGAVRFKYTMSKAAATKVAHARTRRLALTIATTSRTKAVHATLAV
jgi:hypothetical protein